MVIEDISQKIGQAMGKGLKWFANRALGHKSLEYLTKREVYETKNLSGMPNMYHVLM